MSSPPPDAPPLPEQTFFADPAIDRLLGVTMALAAEVYVLRERLHALESRVEPMQGNATSTPDDATAFVARILEPLSGEQQARGPL